MSRALPVTADLHAATMAWEKWLLNIKRASNHTLISYQNDLAHFYKFLSAHLGGKIDLSHLAALEARDFRAWLASRMNDFEAASNARALSTVKRFFRWIEK
jgi:integrase/recombinase XerC